MFMVKKGNWYLNVRGSSQSVDDSTGDVRRREYGNSIEDLLGHSGAYDHVGSHGSRADTL